jgi:hypothetical protein
MSRFAGSEFVGPVQGRLDQDRRRPGRRPGELRAGGLAASRDGDSDRRGVGMGAGAYQRHRRDRQQEPAAWQNLAKRPRTPEFLPCCCPRALLQEALDALTTPAARALAKLISEPDDVFLRRTISDPHIPAGLPWWDRRRAL